MLLKSSQIDMEEHSAKKVELLQKYLDAYLSVIGHDNYTEEIHCYDMFCGEGQYPNGGIGSPIVFANALRKSAAIHKSKRFSLVFNDKNSEKVKRVQALVGELGTIPSNLHIFESNKDFEEMVRWVIPRLEKLRKEKALLFIDPYGYKDTPPSLIRELMKSGNAEVILFLPTQHMFRFSRNGTPESLQMYLEELQMGRQLPFGHTITDYLNFILDGFRAIMPECFVDSFSIRKDAKTWFCLFFFTTNLKGAEKMLEAKWTMDQHQGRGWSYTHSGSELLFRLDAHINPLEKELENFLKEGAKTNAQLYEFVIRNGYLPKHANEILRSFQKASRIHVSPSSVKKGAFYLDYKLTFGGNTKLHKTIKIHLT